MKRKTPPELPPVWEVRITEAVKRISGNRSSFYDYEFVSKVGGQVAVRLTFGGQDRLTFGVADIKDDDFEEKITAMKAAALEKAATLNAVGAE